MRCRPTGSRRSAPVRVVILRAPAGDEGIGRSRVEQHERPRALDDVESTTRHLVAQSDWYCSTVFAFCRVVGRVGPSYRGGAEGGLPALSSSGRATASPDSWAWRVSRWSS